MKAPLRILLCFWLLGSQTASGQGFYLPFDHFPAQYDPVKFKNAAHLNGYSGITHYDYNSVLPFAFSENFTIEFWMKVPPYMASETQPADILTQNDGAITVQLNSQCAPVTETCSYTKHYINFIMNSLQEGYGYVVQGEIPEYNEWFHVALVCNQSVPVDIPEPFWNQDLSDYPGGPDQAINDFYNNQVLPGELGIYINGVRQKEMAPDGYELRFAAPPPQFIRQSDQPIQIGKFGSGIWIDELRIWKIPKYHSAIREGMNDPLQLGDNGFAFQNGLFAYFKYDPGFGIRGTETGSGLNRSVPNMSRGAMSPTSDENFALTGVMTSNPYSYPAFKKGLTFKMVHAGNTGFPEMLWENWAGVFPDFNDDVTIDLAVEPGSPAVADMNSPQYYRSIYFKNGKIRTNGHELFSSRASLGESSKSYVITTKGSNQNVGPFTQSYWVQKDQFVTLPIGTEDYYLPVSLASTGWNSFRASAFVPETIPAGLAEDHMALHVPWDVKTSHETLPGTPYKMKLQWHENNEGPDFDRSHIYFANYHNGAWRRLGTGLPANVEGQGYYSAIVGVNGFSEFTVIGSPVPLPVKLVEFSAKLAENNTSLLQWTTSMEENSSHFVIEKSPDGYNWAAAGRVAAVNSGEKTNHYRFADKLGNWVAPKVYYRLKIEDFDGQTSYSSIVSVIPKLVGTNLAGIYPNPVRDGSFRLPEYLRSNATSVKLISISGNEVFKSLKPESGTVTLPALPPGVYIVEVSGADGLLHREKLVIAAN